MTVVFLGLLGRRARRGPREPGLSEAMFFPSGPLGLCHNLSLADTPIFLNFSYKNAVPANSSRLTEM
jgi:hypothetical protein